MNKPSDVAKDRQELLDTQEALFHMLHDIDAAGEQALKAKAYAESIIQCMGDALLVLNPDGTINTVNRETLRILSYGEDELIGKDAHALVAKESTFPVRLPVTMSGPSTVHEFETILMAKDGTHISMSLSISALRDSNDDLVATICVGRDLREIHRLIAEASMAAVEKKKVEELRAVNQQLRASEQQLEAANQQLRAKEQALRASQEQLVSKMSDLERFNKFMVGRELQMIKLKEEVNSLLEKLGQPPKYEAAR